MDRSDLYRPIARVYGLILHEAKAALAPAGSCDLQ